MKRLAFYRDFHGFSGGHLKVWDYFRYTRQSQNFTPTICFTDASRMDASNPWFAAGEQIQSRWEPYKADALFLGGLDWLAVPEDCSTPVINLVQGVRHADPADARYQFLSQRAIRICISKEVELAILATGRVNGPVITIPAGLDLADLPRPSRERDISLLIVGLKHATMAKRLSDRLAAMGIDNTCLTTQLPRQKFLGLLGRSNVTAFLPYEKEGFYLPALEGMAMGTLVVCPDCVGNREFCVDGTNCYLPPYNESALIEAVRQATKVSKAEKDTMTAEGARQSGRYTLVEERRRYLEVLEAVVAKESSS